MDEMISNFGVECFSDVIFEGIAFSELIVVVFHFISLFEVEVVIREEVIVVLRSYHFVLILFLNVFIGIEKGGFVLSQFVVVIFIIKVV